MLYWIQVPIMAQCQSSGCSLSTQDCAVTRESFWQFTASRLAMLEMAVDDRCCRIPQWKLHYVLIEHSDTYWTWPELISCHHTFTHSFNDVVSLWIAFMNSRRKTWCPQRTDQFRTHLCRGHYYFYLETNGWVGVVSCLLVNLVKANIDLLWMG